MHKYVVLLLSLSASLPAILLAQQAPTRLIHLIDLVDGVCLNWQIVNAFDVVMLVLGVVDQVVVNDFNGPANYELVSCIALMLTCNELQLVLVETTLSIGWHAHTCCLLIVCNIF